MLESVRLCFIVVAVLFLSLLVTLSKKCYKKKAGLPYHLARNRTKWLSNCLLCFLFPFLKQVKIKERNNDGTTTGRRSSPPGLIAINKGNVQCSTSKIQNLENEVDPSSFLMPFVEQKDDDFDDDDDPDIGVTVKLEDEDDEEEDETEEGRFSLGYFTHSPSILVRILYWKYRSQIALPYHA